MQTIVRCFFVLVATLLGASSQPCCADEAHRHPNIVLIYTDDVGYGDVGCYGATGVATPHIDRLAKEGLRHLDAHASAATCTPSRFSLLTGTYAFRSGARILAGNAGLCIPLSTVTLPKMLQQSGYDTAIVGKWHLGLGNAMPDWNGEITPGPKEVGFDYHFLVPATGDRVPCVYVEQGRVVGLDANDPITVSYGSPIGIGPTGKERPDLLKQRWSHGHNATIVNGISRIGFMTGGTAARWVDEDMADTLVSKSLTYIRRAVASPRPFFLMFSTHDIHVPRVPHKRFRGKSQMSYRGDVIAQMDWCVGKLLGVLDELRITRETLVIFTSDNGPVLDDGYVDEANEKLGDHRPAGPLRAGKYSLFEGGTRVPTLVRWTGRVKAHTESTALFGQVDLAASITSLVGATVPAGAFPDSRNELDTLLGTDTVGRPHLVHEAGRLALRMGRWKYVPPGKTRDGLGPWSQVTISDPGVLFDLDSPERETKNIATEHPQQLQQMKELLAQIRQSPDGTASP